MAIPKKDLQNYPILTIKYDTYCIRLAALLHPDTRPKDPKDLTTHIALVEKTLTQAYALNRDLAKVYQASGVHLKTQQATLNAQAKRLAFFKAKLKNPEATEEKEASVSDDISNTMKALRTNTGKLNPLRLFLARGRRFFVNLITAVNNLGSFSDGFKTADTIIGPFLNYLAWIFLLPRLLVNTFLMFWHLIDHDKLSEEEKALSKLDRFKLQWEERWFQLANDAIWVPGGILCCFLLLGPFAMIGLYLTIAMFVWDVVTAGIRAGIELNRLNTLLKTLPDKTDEDQLTRNALKNHIVYEKKRHALAIGNTSLVALLMCFALCLFVINPIIPLIASCILIVATVAVFLMSERIDASKPTHTLMPFKDKNGETQDPTLAFFNTLYPSPLSNRDTSCPTPSTETLKTP